MFRIEFFDGILGDIVNWNVVFFSINLSRHYVQFSHGGWRYTFRLLSFPASTLESGRFCHYFDVSKQVGFRFTSRVESVETFDAEAVCAKEKNGWRRSRSCRVASQ